MTSLMQKLLGQARVVSSGLDHHSVLTEQVDAVFKRRIASAKVSLACVMCMVALSKPAGEALRAWEINI